jgi:hypothetical protein
VALRPTLSVWFAFIGQLCNELHQGHKSSKDGSPNTSKFDANTKLNNGGKLV